MNNTYCLAIKGDSKRGNEIINILEMLGGKNVAKHDGKYEDSFYFIDNENENIISFFVIGSLYDTNRIVLTIDEFLIRFPFKVGEKVKSASGNWYTTIIEMKEIDCRIKYRVQGSGIYYFQEATSFEKCNQSKYSNEVLEAVIHILKDLQNNYKGVNELAYNAYAPIIIDVNNQLEYQKKI